MQAYGGGDAYIRAMLYAKLMPGVKSIIGNSAGGGIFGLAAFGVPGGRAGGRRSEMSQAEEKVVPVKSPVKPAVMAVAVLGSSRWRSIWFICGASAASTFPPDTWRW